MSKKMKITKNTLLKHFHIRDLWFIGDVTDDSARDFLEKMRDVVEETLSAPNAKKETIIRVNICSTGGDVDPGWSICNYIENCPIPVWTHISGTAQSMAAAIFMSGHIRSCAREATMMVHHFQITSSGTPTEASSNAQFFSNNEKLYAKKFPNLKFTDTMGDIYMDSKEIVKKGWVSFIM